MTAIRPIRTILCPVDFSAASEYALQYALELGRGTGARVHLAHVFELPLYVMPEGAMLATPADVMGIRRSLERDLAALRKKYEPIAETHLVDGVAWREIDALAKQIDADLIVLGTHGRTGFSRLLLGSVAEKVVRTAPVPVLTVHDPAAEKQHEEQPPEKQAKKVQKKEEKTA